MALAVSSSAGYIHFPPETMRKMRKQSTNIRVLAVKKHDKDKGVIGGIVDEEAPIHTDGLAVGG